MKTNLSGQSAIAWTVGPCVQFSLGLLFLTGCGSPASTSQPKTQIFVSQVTTSDALLAFVVEDSGKSLAYVCDNTTVAEWFQGAANQQSLDLTSAGGAHLQATPASGQAGLYRAKATIDGLEYVGGWVVLPDGRVEGQVRQGSTQVAASLFHLGDMVPPFASVTLTPEFTSKQIEL